MSPSRYPTHLYGRPPPAPASSSGSRQTGHSASTSSPAPDTRALLIMLRRELNDEAFVCIHMSIYRDSDHLSTYLCLLFCVGFGNITCAAWDAMVTSKNRGAAASPYSVAVIWSQYTSGSDCALRHRTDDSSMGLTRGDEGGLCDAGAGAGAGAAATAEAARGKNDGVEARLRSVEERAVGPQQGDRRLSHSTSVN